MIIAFVLILAFLIYTLFMPSDEVVVEPKQPIRINPNINQLDHSLFITDFANAKDYETLKALGVRQILIVGEELPRHGEQFFRVQQIKIKDLPTENIKKFFNASFNFIKQAPTVIHCAAGISRSTTILASYIMRRDNLTTDQALNIIRRARPIINPNPGFVSQLRALEKELKNKKGYEETEENGETEENKETNDVGESED